MKVFFFEPYALAIPHFETALELIQTHIDNNDEVNLFYCAADLNSCESNYHHSLITCAHCISRRKNGLKTILGLEKVKKRNFIDLSPSERKLVRDWDIAFKNIDDLKAFKFENTDIGMAVASSFISLKRNPEPDLGSDAVIINRLFKASLKVYLSFKKILQREKPDLVYLFNGRFSNIRPVVRLCEMNNITYKIHERGSNKTKYSLHENHLPHDFVEFQKLVEEHWESSPQDERIKVAENFYSDRKNGKEQAWHSFVASQNKKELPNNWGPSKRNIVIFNSSEDEFAAIGDTLKERLFRTQLEGLKFIAELVKDQSNISVYVRIHPNLKGIKNSTVTGIYDLCSANFHVIDPDSTISSYALIDSSDVIVTFGSTVGIEATFWNKPSILLGDSFYKDLGSTYNPRTQDELSKLLLDDHPAKEKLGAYKYGFYINSYGIDYNLYQAEGLFAGRFKGEKIRQSTWMTSKWIRGYLKRKPLSPIINFLSRVHADKF